MKKIYGNEYLCATLASMTANNKAAHSVLFFGEKGLGKKLMAKFYTELLLCENPINGAPCGTCRSCRNIENGFHPDVVYAPTSGKLGGYSVETARSICSDAFIMPNNSSGKKVYLFCDCHKMDTRTQNTLLKLIEEPPDYAYFIFTSESKSDFLPTIISRCVCFGLSVCTEEETKNALIDDGCSEKDAVEAINCFHGNIGQCLAFLNDGNLRQTVDLTKSIADSIIRRDEYMLNTALFTLGKERDAVRNTLSLLDKLVRDAAVLGKDKNSAVIGCYRDGAVKLSTMITVYQAARMHKFIEKAWNTIEFNVNIPLTLAALSGEMINCL